MLELEGVLSRPHLVERLRLRGRTVAGVMQTYRAVAHVRGNKQRSSYIAASMADGFHSREVNLKGLRVNHWLKVPIAFILSCGSPTRGAETGPQAQRHPAAAWQVPPAAARRVNPVAADESSIARGKELYLQECAACHGFEGKGDGGKWRERNRDPELDVSPADLSSPTMRKQADGTLFWKITEGKVPMPSFNLKFSVNERWMIVHYLRTLAAKNGASGSEAEKAPQNQSLLAGSRQTPGQATNKNNSAPADESAIARGKELYVRECADCHGAAGKGDGARAPDLKVNPADLSGPGIQQQTDEALFSKIAAGKKPMPAFETKLSEKERRVIIGYIRTLASRKAGDTAGNGTPAEGPQNGSTRASSSPTAYFHVLINPMPVYGLAAAALALLAALLMRNRPAQLLALWLVFLCAASAWPAWFLGHKAYHQVHLMVDGDGQSWLDLHMHRADKWVYAFYALAATALLAALLPAKRAPKISFLLAVLTLTLALACLAAGGWIAKAGGQIRHPEFRTQSASHPSLEKTEPGRKTGTGEQKGGAPPPRPPP